MYIARELGTNGLARGQEDGKRDRDKVIECEKGRDRVRKKENRRRQGTVTLLSMTRDVTPCIAEWHCHWHLHGNGIIVISMYVIVCVAGVYGRPLVS